MQLRKIKNNLRKNGILRKIDFLEKNEKNSKKFKKISKSKKSILTLKEAFLVI